MSDMTDEEAEEKTLSLTRPDWERSQIFWKMDGSQAFNAQASSAAVPGVSLKLPTCQPALDARVPWLPDAISQPQDVTHQHF